MNPAYTSCPSSDRLFDAADLAYNDLKVDAVSPAWLGWSHGEVERELTTRFREVVRHILQAHINLRAQAEPIGEVVGADGLARTHVRPAERRGLQSSFGPVSVQRAAHTGRRLTSVFPVDADLNLPSHSFTHEVERLVARTAANLSYDDTAAHIRSATDAKVAKRQIESITRRAAADFHAFYEARKWTPDTQKDTGPLVVLSFDQKGVVVQTKELRGRTLKLAQSRKARLRSVHNRDGKKHHRGRKRMAMVGTVYTIHRDRRTAIDVVNGLQRLQGVVERHVRTVRPELKRAWASVGQEPFEVVVEAFDEALKRDPDQSKEWVVLIDGDPDLSKWVGRAAQQRGVKVTLVLDIIHVLQYLWGAGQDICQSDDAIESWVLTRLTRILEGQVSSVIGGMTRAATKLRLQPAQRARIDKCADYCLQRKDLMKYDALLAAGAPIATGVIEGTCKHLIANRCDKSGARWSLAGADAVLRLRAIQISGDFDAYWKFHEAAELRRNHESMYLGNQTPRLKPLQMPSNVVPIGARQVRRSK